MDYQEYFELYNKEFEFLKETKYFTFKRGEGTYLATLLDDLYNRIEHLNNYLNFVNVIEGFYKEKGLSDMAIYKAFRVADGILKPIKNVLNITFNDLIGLDYQKKLLCENTENFILGKPYNNVLLYGDAGTGKSSSIKALINEYFDKGLRIIEVYKHQMAEISKIINKLKSRPYHYIIYMDDLSFEEDEIEYKYLKSIIEGGIEPKPENVVIYATSNRRHLIKETIKDNGDVFDDLHRNETQAEKLSLSYRFGLQIFYSSLSPEEFRTMVKKMAEDHNIQMDENALVREAFAFQMRNGTLSGRCAEQFIKYLSNKIQK
ncbi:MAG: ATP-binding protein, partial [Acholeplasmatales bacterium]|nr:ATP-binding protein [Acholeplasmatales bacterium]